PLDRATSSALAMRLLSPGLSLAAPAGSSRTSAAKLSATLAARTSARMAGSIGGTGAMPSSSVRRHRPVPPTRIGGRRWAWRRPVGRRTGLGAASYPVETMLGEGALRGGRRGREDRQVAVELGAVGIDDRPAALLGELQGQRRLAARRRTGNEGDRRLVDLGHCNADSSRAAGRKTGRRGA